MRGWEKHVARDSEKAGQQTSNPIMWPCSSWSCIPVREGSSSRQRASGSLLLLMVPSQPTSSPRGCEPPSVRLSSTPLHCISVLFDIERCVRRDSSMLPLLQVFQRIPLLCTTPPLASTVHQMRLTARPMSPTVYPVLYSMSAPRLESYRRVRVGSPCLRADGSSNIRDPAQSSWTCSPGGRDCFSLSALSPSVTLRV